MSQTTRTLKPYFLKHWPALAAACVATLVLTAAELAKPWPLKFVLDELLGAHGGAFDPDQTEMRLLVAMGLAVIAIAAVDAAGKFFADSLLQTAGERIMHTLRMAVYSHLQRLSLGFHHRRQKGDLVTRVTADATAIGELFAHSVGQLAQSALFVVGMIVVTFIIDPLLALVSCVTMPVLTVLSIVFRRRIRVNAKRQRDAEGEIASLADEALSAMPVVKAFGAERYEHHRVKRRSERRMEIGIALRRLQTRYEGLVAVLISVGTALVLVVGALRVAAGAMTPGDLVVFAMYARMVDKPLRTIAKEYTKAARVLAKADRLAEVLAADEVLEERSGAFRGGRADGDIRLEGVSFAYGDDRGCVEDVSLHIPAGSRAALIGPSGAGKSTLSALIARFYDPTAGRVLLDGRDARECSLDWLRAQFGLVLQDTVLFQGTVEDNIAYGTGASHERVVAAAKAADAHGFISAMPAGYATMLGPQGLGLSGGQRQRLGIARTILRDPPILLLDEPTTGLDVDSERQVLAALWALMRGRTTIVVTHSLELARQVDQVVVVESGRVVCAGPPADVLAHGVPFGRPAGAGVAAARRSPPPADPALPQLERLLDMEEMTTRLSWTLRRPGMMTDAHVAHVRYEPGERVAVHFRATIAGRRADAVALAAAGADFGRQVRSRAFAVLAERVEGRAPSGRAAVYDPALDARLCWLPFEPELPAMALAPEELARRIDAVTPDVWRAAPERADLLREASTALRSGSAQPELVDYRPGRLAVLELGGQVLKVVGDDAAYQRAVSGLRQASAWGLTGARFLGAFRDLRLTLQSAVPGHPPLVATDGAYEAGAFVRELQAMPAAALPERPTDAVLATALRRADLLRAVAPAHAHLVDALARRLAGGRPEGTRLVPAHGSLQRDRLAFDDGAVRVRDFEGLCLAAPAHDLATYAAAVLRGRADDQASLEAVVEALLDGYGDPPPGLAWHIAAVALGRAARPFHQQLPDWSERIESVLESISHVLDSPLQEVTV